MKMQEAAYRLLVEAQEWLTPMELAARALERGMVKESRAIDPARSMAGTLRKNINEGRYNDPELAITTRDGRQMVGLPGWEEATPNAATPDTRRNTMRVEVCLPVSWQQRLAFARRIGFAPSDNEIMVRLLELGYEALAAKVANLWQKAKSGTSSP